MRRLQRLIAATVLVALSGALADKVSPQAMLPALMGGTKAMMVNLDPALTLREVFDAHFFLKFDFGEFANLCVLVHLFGFDSRCL